MQADKIIIMKVVKLISNTLLFLLIFFITVYLNPGSYPKQFNTFYQLSTINALIEGNYEGVRTVKQLKKHGDFGHGTLDSLNGEVYVLDGDFYQIDYSGFIKKLEDSSLIPYINLVFFSADKKYPNQNITDFAGLEDFANKNLPSKNLPYAIKIHGVFDSLKLRSVAKQKKPYPPINEIIASQSIFNPEKVTGTMVGFLLPRYTQGVLVPGFHFHFISDDFKNGGHVLEFTNLTSANIEIDLLKKIEIELPLTQDFLDSNLDKDNSDLIHKVEK